MELSWRILLIIAVSGCAHKQAHPLKFYHIAKDIQHGTNFEGDPVDHDLHIPPQTKNIAILLSQRHPHYRDLRYGFKIFQQRPTERANLRVRVLRGRHRITRLTRAVHQRRCTALSPICRTPRCVIL